MFKKVKEYFKGKNPYLLASAAIVIVSVVIISLILKDGMSAGQEADTVTVSMQQSLGESVEDTENLRESGKTEVSESWDEETVEIPSKEEPETTEVFVVEDVETSQVPVMTPEPIVTPQLEKAPEQEETLAPEVVPESQPEPSAPQEPETVTPEEPSVPEETPAPEFMPEPEPTPIPDVTPAPEMAPSPEVTPVPEPTPSPEMPPTPHEHSWIFDSWYQEPTCSNGGLVIEICGHCGETQVTGGTPTGEHSFTVESQGDCCSEEVVVCVECNHREVREKNPSNHIDVEDGFCYGCGVKTG